MKKGKLGFTLIELIVVIVILGILAAFALPRFADLDKQARKAITEGLGGSIRAASALAHGVGLATDVVNGSISMEGTTVTLENSYPASSDIEDTIVDISGFSQNAKGDSPRTFWPDGVSDSSDCKIEYTAAAPSSSPTINVITTDCG